MEKEQRLGRKAFWLFVLINSGPAIIFLFITLTSAIGRVYAPESFSVILNYLTWATVFLFIILGLGDFLTSWLTYKNYTFTLGDSALRVKRGILNTEETAIPYRQIQSIDVRQDVFGQILGFGRLVILTAGHDMKDQEGEAELVFPAMDREFIKGIQAELLRRSETERVTVQK